MYNIKADVFHTVLLSKKMLSGETELRHVTAGCCSLDEANHYTHTQTKSLTDYSKVSVLLKYFYIDKISK